MEKIHPIFTHQRHEYIQNIIMILTSLAMAVIILLISGCNSFRSLDPKVDRAMNKADKSYMRDNLLQDKAEKEFMKLK